ncbi:hypothetical protein SAMN05421863_10419 [Nitrosomonas communis]|uniref:Uncharacterized protein n=1 Tax=Nitrosomonas communis TaxID=44574 RepID=A0A1I4SJA5_9PROT|nr:hypothetical protein SAMN05421863_10419 [Nitrosomonas communis]
MEFTGSPANSTLGMAEGKAVKREVCVLHICSSERKDGLPAFLYSYSVFFAPGSFNRRPKTDRGRLGASQHYDYW